MQFHSGGGGGRWPDEGREAASPRFDSSRALRLLKELGTNITEDLLVLMPNLLSFLRHDDPAVVRQTISRGTILFAAVLEEMAFQIKTYGQVGGWLEEMLSWVVQFKDTVRAMVQEPGSVSTKLLAIKLFETCFLCFTPPGNDYLAPLIEGKKWSFDVARLAKGHPRLDPAVLEADARRTFSLLLDVLQSAYAYPGSLLVAVINCLAAIAKYRPLYYGHILPVLLGFDPSVETVKGAHSASIRYCLRTAFIGFLKWNHQVMIESRDKLISTVRELWPGEATEQIIRQLSRNTERFSRETRAGTDDSSLAGRPFGDLNRKRSAAGVPAVSDGLAKRTRLDTAIVTNIQKSSNLQDDDYITKDSSSNAPLLSNNSTPAETMIGMIGALLAEGERGAESLRLVISTIQEDLMADIVIETMKHLPKTSILLSSRNGILPMNFQTPSSVLPEILPNMAHSAVLPSQFAPIAADSTGVSISVNTPINPSIHADAKRDPRRDPRRLDPQRMVAPPAQSSGQLNTDNSMGVHLLPDQQLSNKPKSLAEIKVEDDSRHLPNSENEQLKSSSVLSLSDVKDDPEISNGVRQPESSLGEQISPDDELAPPLQMDYQELGNPYPSDIAANDVTDSSSLEFDQFSSPTTKTSSSEETSNDLPMLPSHVELSDEEKRMLHRLAIGRIIDGHASNNAGAWLPLLARLIAQGGADEGILELLQKNLFLDYHYHKGHELAMHVLYHLQAVMVADSQGHSTYVADQYEKFFTSLAKALINSLPASDKSFSKLLGEAPFLPNSVFRLLEDLCQSNCSSLHAKDIDVDRINQGLGTLLSLILGCPSSRQACLDISFKSAVHTQDEVRARAVRFVANKLYPLPYATEKVEQFATDMLSSVVDQAETEVSNQETSTSGSPNSEPGVCESDSAKSSLISPKISAVSLSQAQCHTSLFFALCIKKPSLLRRVFDLYDRAPKAVKQAIHRQIPVLVRNLGSGNSELLEIIHSLPEGSENLVTLVLKILTEESNPSADLIASVKHLYENKMKDVAILIPLLSSLSKEEVLPIFPRLVDLPLEKFQAALARILQGSAHTGPALTPAEVLIAIHDINPDRDGVTLKKIIDACTACFEQRTVFTEQVLAKSLNQLVDKVPIPLLFMRTVIQAVDAFPALVEFIMGILSRLVNKQIWKMPKLWVGFLKCAYQTQPHSFHVLLELPPTQLENALTKYPNLRVPLASHVNQQNIHSTMPRHTLTVLGLVNGPQQAPRSSMPAQLQATDSSSSFHSATLT